MCNVLYCIVWEGNINGYISLRNLWENIDREHLRLPVLAVLLEMENCECQSHQYYLSKHVHVHACVCMHTSVTTLHIAL